MHLPTDARTGVAELERQLTRLVRTSRTAARAVAASHGLDDAGYAVVLLLERIGPAHPCELADELGLDRSTVSRQVAGLTARGLLARSRDPRDGRSVVVSLTDAGRERLEQARAARSLTLRDVLRTWSPEDLDAGAALLARLTADLHGGLPAAHRTTPGPTAAATPPPPREAAPTTGSSSRAPHRITEQETTRTR